MLTILLLIHQWFFSPPKSLQPLPNSESSQKTERNSEFIYECNFGEPVERVPTKSGLSKRSWCSSKFYTTELAVVAVCKISTSVVVPEVELDWAKMSIEEKFRAAVRVIHSLPKDGPYQPSNSTKLKFYGLYKQSTEGKNTTTKPGFWDVIGRAKWDAWNKNGDISKEEAMNKYVDCLKEIVETMSFNGDVEDFLDSIGPFYEFVTLQGNEMNHIKEQIEEVASSSGSSLANSLAASVANSKENSPVKSLSEKEDVEDEEVSTSEKAEVSVENSSVSYETKASKQSKKYSHQNGNAVQLSNGGEHSIPPPAPVHSYSQQNGHVKHALPNDNDDEVLTVSTPYVPCKEDLERDIDEGNSGHPRVRVTSSVETVASNATSGTESEKYYSGDSEPEMDEKLVASFANNPGTSTGALMQQTYLVNNGASQPKKSSSNNPPKKLSKDRVSPKTSSTMVSPSLNADVITQQTVERLNRDVDHILARLRILEAAYAASAEGAIRAPANQVQQRIRVFGNLSTQSIAFIIMWPFVVQFLIKLLRWWWRRRRNVIRSITHSTRLS